MNPLISRSCDSYACLGYFIWPSRGRTVSTLIHRVFPPWLNLLLSQLIFQWLVKPLLTLEFLHAKHTTFCDFLSSSILNILHSVILWVPLYWTYYIPPSIYSTIEQVSHCQKGAALKVSTFCSITTITHVFNYHITRDYWSPLWVSSGPRFRI